MDDERRGGGIYAVGDCCLLDYDYDFEGRLGNVGNSGRLSGHWGGRGDDLGINQLGKEGVGAKKRWRSGSTYADDQVNHEIPIIERSFEVQ